MSWRASSGLRSWLLQRLTALYMVIFLVIFLVVWQGQSITFEIWRAWVSHPAANIALMLFFFSLLMHAWIGARDVIIDYIHGTGVKYLLLVVFSLGLVILGLWVMRILLLVGTG